MRLWHKSLIPYLPRQQLLAQWRECCAIAKSIAEKGTPNHILVNKIMEYPTIHFLIYSTEVVNEIERRAYKVSKRSQTNFQKNYDRFKNQEISGLIFYGWHNDRYLKQCLYNLQEKYDCGGISEREWLPIEDVFKGWMSKLGNKKRAFPTSCDKGD